MRTYILLLALLCCTSQVLGQDVRDPQYDDWEFTLAPYLFMASINGDAAIAVDGRSEVDLNFGDLLKKLQFAFMMRGEVFKGNWGVMADYLYMRLGDDLDTPEDVVANIELRQSIFELFVSRRIRHAWGWVDVYGGIRTWYFKTDLNLEGLDVTRVSFKENWVDPVIGGRAVLQFSDRFKAIFRGDIGGFGVGSDFSYTAQAGVGYHFADWFGMSLQYKYLYVDYNNDKAAPDLFIYDAATNGPLLGMVFQF